MKSLLITESERNRILGMHKSATSKHYLMEQTVTTFGTRKVYANNDNGNLGEGFFGIPQGNIVVGPNVKNLKNYYGSGTSTESQQGDKNNEIRFNVVKIIKGKNAGKSIDLRVNGKSVSTLDISYPEGDNSKEYYVYHFITISDLKPGSNMVTMVVDNTQVDAATFNKYYLSFNVE
jgi:hypothetical protein